MALVGGIFLRLTCGDFLGKVTPGVEFGGDRVHRWHLRVLVTLLGDELAADLSGAYTCMQTLGALPQVPCCGSCGIIQHPLPEEIQLHPAIATPLDQLQAVDVAFDRPV